MNGNTVPKVCFIAPSTCLPRARKAVSTRPSGSSRRGSGSIPSISVRSSSPATSRSTTSRRPAEARSEHFKKVIREQDLIFSVAGGTGAEDLARKIDAKDLRDHPARDGPSSSGFSDFTFLLNEIYFHTRVPAIYFPSLKARQGEFPEGPPPDQGRGDPISGRRLADPPSGQEVLGHPHRREPVDLRQLPQPQGPPEVQLEAAHPVHRGHPDRRRGPPPAPGGAPPPPRLQGHPGDRRRLAERARPEPQRPKGPAGGR